MDSIWVSAPFKEARCWQLLQTFTLLSPVNQGLEFILIGTMCSYAQLWTYCCEQRLWVCWLSNSHFWNQDRSSTQSIEGFPPKEIRVLLPKEKKKGDCAWTITNMHPRTQTLMCSGFCLYKLENWMSGDHCDLINFLKCH